MKFTTLALIVLCTTFFGCKKVYNKKMSIQITNPITGEGLSQLLVDGGLVKNGSLLKRTHTNQNGYAEINIETSGDAAAVLTVHQSSFDEWYAGVEDSASYAFDKLFINTQYYSTKHQGNKHINVQFIKTRPYKLVILPNNPTDTMDSGNGIFIHQLQDQFFNEDNGFLFRRLPFESTEDGFTKFELDLPSSVYIGKNTLRLNVKYLNGQEVDLLHDFILDENRPVDQIDTLILP